MSKSALLRLADDIAADRRISADEALQMRGEIFPDGVVSRQEADVLISLHGLVEQHDAAWALAFAEAVTDHALQAGMLPGHVEAETAEWLIARLDGQGVVALEAALKVAERAESVPDTFMNFARVLVAEYVAGRAMSAADVEYVRRALYASGGAGGVAVEHDELVWLFALDAATQGFEHDAGWKDLFVKAALCHVVGRRAPAILEAEVMRERETRLSGPRRVSAHRVFESFTQGGFAGFWSRLTSPDFAARMETRYGEINVEAEADAKLTADEAAMMLGLAEKDGALTPNEQALMAALREMEAS